MASALLWPYSAENRFLILRLSRPAGRSKRIFTGGAAKVKWWSELQMQLTVTTTLVKKGIQKSPQAFLNPE